MQREEPKKTKITIREDYPTAVASEAYGANVGGFAFNVIFIAHRNPELAVKVMDLYEKATALKDEPPLEEDDPKFDKATEKFNKMCKRRDNG